MTNPLKNLEEEVHVGDEGSVLSTETRIKCFGSAAFWKFHSIGLRLARYPASRARQFLSKKTEAESKTAAHNASHAFATVGRVIRPEPEAFTSSESAPASQYRRIPHSPARTA
jgi:hypothetical protein